VRLFVAVWPPDEVLDSVALLPRPVVDGVRWTTRDQWHVTLRFLGSVDDPTPVVSRLRALPVPAVVADAGPAVAALSRSILCLPVAGLDALAAAVVGATADVGEPPEERRFRGHLTLARARDRRRGDVRGLAGAPFAASWPVSAVELVASELRPSGAAYTVLASVGI
jgi:2'-5' RNA ligase